MSSIAHGGKDEPGQSPSNGKRWQCLMDEGWYDRIRQTPWKIMVLDRLYRVLEDVRRAISNAGLILDETGDEPQVSTLPGCSRAGRAKTAGPPNDPAALAEEADAIVKVTFQHIARAVQSLTPPDGRWWRRWWDRLSRESQMPAYFNLHSAETSRVLLLSGDQLMAILPSIRQRAASYLPADDPRRVALGGIPDLTAPVPQTLTRLRNDIIGAVTGTDAKPQAPALPTGQHQAERGIGWKRMRLLSRRRAAWHAYAGGAGRTGNADGLAQDQTGSMARDQAVGMTGLTDMLGRDQQIAAEALGEACKSEDLQQLQVKRFRSVLWGTFVGLFALLVLMGVVASLRPAFFPLCLQEQGKPTGTLICPGGSHAPIAADLPLILGLGALGASLAVAMSLAGQKVAVGVRYSLAVAQGFVKLAFGAITAVLGILLLSTQAGVVTGILGTQQGLLTAAAVFGYAQQIFTRLIDRRANSLLSAASPATPTANQDPGSSQVSGTP